MKWAVYADENYEISCVFFETRADAKAHINELIKSCELASVDSEENLHWDITLLEVKGECHWTQDGLTLIAK
jgi:hypothetical protein